MALSLLDLGKLGLPTAIGAILGIGLVTYVQPETAGGTALLVIVCVLLTNVVSQIVLFAFRMRRRRLGGRDSPNNQQPQ
jgi:hypothetical protein